MGFDFLGRFGFRAPAGGGVGLASGMHELHGAGDVLVVHDQQGAVIAGGRWHAAGAQTEKVHAVVVVTRAAGKVVLRAIVQVVRHRSVNGVARGVDDRRGVTGRHRDAVQLGLVHSGKAQRDSHRRRGHGQRHG